MTKSSETKKIEIQNYQQQFKLLPDLQLVESLKVYLKQEAKIGDLILMNLHEIQRRRVFALLGYSSLFEFLVKHFSMSETAAYQRTSALKIIQAVPEAQIALSQGETNLSCLAVIQKFIKSSEALNKKPMTPEEKKETFAAVRGKTHKEAQKILAQKNPLAILPANKEKPLTAEHTQLQVTLENETLDLLQKLKNLLSHEIPDGDLNKLIKKISHICLESLEKKKGRKGNESETGKNSDQCCNSEKVSEGEGAKASEKACEESTERAVQARGQARAGKAAVQARAQKKEFTRYIPVDVKRKVFQRANSSCEYLSPDGKKCSSSFQLEVDHIKSFSQGGTHQLENLRIFCRSHNQYRTKQTHGFWFKE